MRTAKAVIFAALTIWLSAASGASSAELSEGPGLNGRAHRVAVVRRGGVALGVLSARAEAEVGYKYQHGFGVPQSYEMAVLYYTSAAERGDPTGQYLLGLMYDKGFGVRQDGILAHMWLNLAAARVAKPRYRDYFLRLRDAEATKMTPRQIITAQRLAVEWLPKP